MLKVDPNSTRKQNLKTKQKKSALHCHTRHVTLDECSKRNPTPTNSQKQKGSTTLALDSNCTMGLTFQNFCPAMLQEDPNFALN